MAGFTYAAPASGHSGGGAGGPLGFVSNLVKDVGSAAYGFGPGIVHLAEHPIGGAEQVGKATWQDWSPLFHGHFRQFGHNVYQHPLAPMLDVLTVFSGGAALAGKLGEIGLAAGTISPESALGRIASMPKTLTISDPNAAEGAVGRDFVKSLPRNPLYNKGYRSIVSAADKHPLLPNWLGSKGVYSRLEFRDKAQAHLALAAQFSANLKAGEVLVKAGHDPKYLGALANQLHGQAYKDLLHNSPEIPVSEITSKYGGQLPKGYAPVKIDVPADGTWYKKGPTNLDQFAQQIRDLGGQMLLKKGEWKKGVYTNADGVPVVKIAHNNAFNRTLADGAKSVPFLRALYKYPTAVWKMAQVGFAPSTLVKNTVGNWTMYMLRNGGAHAFHGMLEAVRYSKGERAALDFVKKTGRLPEDSFSPSYFRHFKGELGNTYATAMRPDVSAVSAEKVGTGESGALTLSGEKPGILSKAYQHSIYVPVHNFADRPVRAASIATYLRNDSLVKGLMKQGKSFEDAADYAVQHNGELRDRAINHARSVAGNYVTLGPGEQALRDLVPFYLWDKHILMHVHNMIRDRPAVVAGAAAVGQAGADQARKQLGDVPTWMLGEIPVHIPGTHVDVGRTQLFETSGLSPYSSVADLTEAAQQLTTGHSEGNHGDQVLGELSPVLQGFIEQATGVTGTGAPVQSHGGIVPSILTSMFNGIRPIEIARQAAGAGKPDTTKSGNPTLYKTDMQSLLSSLVGAPVKQANLPHAVQLQKQIENHGKKPKKGKGFTYASR